MKSENRWVNQWINEHTIPLTLSLTHPPTISLTLTFPYLWMTHSSSMPHPRRDTHTLSIYLSISILHTHRPSTFLTSEWLWQRESLISEETNFKSTICCYTETITTTTKMTGERERKRRGKIRGMEGRETREQEGKGVLNRRNQWKN